MCSSCQFLISFLQYYKKIRVRCTSLPPLCTAPGRLVIFFPFRYVMRSFVISCISARRKLPLPPYFPREPGGIFPVLLRRITAGLCSTHTHTYSRSFSLSLSLPFSPLYISFFHYYCESCVRVLVRGSGRLACIREIRRDNVVSEIVWWLYIVNTME